MTSSEFLSHCTLISKHRPKLWVRKGKNKPLTLKSVKESYVYTLKRPIFVKVGDARGGADYCSSTAQKQPIKKLRPNNRAGGVKVNEYAALLWMMAEKKFHWVDYGKTQRFGGGCIRLELEWSRLRWGVEPWQLCWVSLEAWTRWLTELPLHSSFSPEAPVLVSSREILLSVQPRGGMHSVTLK